MIERGSGDAASWPGLSDAAPGERLAEVEIGGGLAAAEQARGYAAYFASGCYAARYPGPNRLTLARTLRLLPPPGEHPVDIVDYGCGNGRYLVPLLQCRPDLRAVAADPCTEALAGLAARLEALGLADRVRLVAGDLDAVRVAVAGADFAPRLALLLFGVLGHVQPQSERVQLLTGLARLLRPSGGRLALSVPNERRRFAGGGRPRGVADIVYRRRLADGASVRLGYHLYRTRELHAELAAAGFADIAVAAESLAGESGVTTRSWLGRLDAVVTPLVPAAWGYGLFAVARAQSS